MKFRSNSVEQTQKIASSLAKKIIKIGSQRHAQIFALEGELGAGKTTFVKGFASALGIKAHITSPTFVLMKRYAVSMSKTYLYHIDAYRLRNHRDLMPLGIKEIMADPRNIILIEWSDRVKKILPGKYVKVHIDHINGNTRKIEIK
ncbi:MAG: tRNA (adenosine(37)-N6)-threonylcarbamoyltransferase complex ATPase subunit type 1 TsaE [Candidatus Yanofskybacteria bacterium]|nr:tRNA (adenosine(37)-N6)-threonylcarbamoyltransferase complex ATPase subunit type 1 TsaE [Candidatus Yanofskybacteria bacterium]